MWSAAMERVLAQSYREYRLGLAPFWRNPLSHWASLQGLAYTRLQQLWSRGQTTRQAACSCGQLQLTIVFIAPHFLPGLSVSQATLLFYSRGCGER
jgi:hypothetical protein